MTQDRRPWFLGERETGDSESGPDGGSEWDGTVQTVADWLGEHGLEPEAVEVAEFGHEEDARYACAARNACVQLGLTPEALEGGALVRLVEKVNALLDCLKPFTGEVKEECVGKWFDVLHETVKALAPFTPPKEAPDAP